MKEYIHAKCDTFVGQLLTGCDTFAGEFISTIIHFTQWKTKLSATPL